jgi:K+-transporting ATPase ATPase C chain
MKAIKTAFLLFLVMTLLTGVFYPLAVTALAQGFFPFQANGSLIDDPLGRKIGSELIAQKFISPRYFWPRPSAVDYNPLPSGGSNLAVGSQAFQKQIVDQRQLWVSANPTAKDIPADLLTASASGLDPHISVESALLQVDRIVQARHWALAQKRAVLKLIQTHTEGRTWGILGEPRVNVLKLNMALDKGVVSPDLSPNPSPKGEGHL